jgi:hypothetical protein
VTESTLPPPAKLQPALLGGLFLGVLTALPIVNLANCCCLWLIGGGMVAAWVMQQNHLAPIRVSDGVVAGVLAGIVGAVVTLLVSLPLNAVLAPVYDVLRARLLQNAQDMPPEFREAIEALGIGAPSHVVSFFTNVLLGAVFAGAGGMLGAVLFRRKPAAAEPPLPPLVPPGPTDEVAPPSLPLP